MLIGRERERQRLAAILEDARRGRSTTLIVVGGPGVGKTALLDDTREAAQDMTRLTAAGAESESELPFASLHELIRPLLPLLSEIPQAQRRAVSAALALAEGNANMLAVGAAQHLRERTVGRGPVLGRGACVDERPHDGMAKEHRPAVDADKAGFLRGRERVVAPASVHRKAHGLTVRLRRGEEQRLAGVVGQLGQTLEECALEVVRLGCRKGELRGQLGG